MAKKSFDEIWGASYASDETKKNDKKSFDEIWGTSYKSPKNTGETVKAAPSVVLETTIEEKPVETKQPVKTANGLLTAEETNKVLQNYGIRPADQSEMYGFKESAGYVGEQALKGLQGGIGGLVNAASTFLDKPFQTVNALGSFGSKFSTSNDYSQYDPATAEALRQKDAEIEQLRRQMYSNLDENFLDSIAQKGTELGAGMIAESQESNYDRDKLSGVGRFTGDVAKAVTGMAPSIAASVIATPFAGAATASTIGLSVMGAGAYGQSLQQALNDGASYEDAVVYGLASAGVEIATEKLFGGIPFFGEGAVDDVLKEWMQAKLGTGTGKKVVEYLVDSVGEGAEEYISEVAGEFLVDIYTDERKDKDFFDRLMDVQDDAFYSFLLGAVTGGVMGAPGDIVDSIKTGKQTATQEVKQDQTNNIAEENQPVKAQEKSTEDPVLAGVRQMADAQIDAEAAQKQQTVEPVKQTDAITEGLKSDNMMVRYEAQRQNKQATIDSAKQTGADIKKATKIADYANKVGIRVVFKDLTYTDKNGKTVTPEGMYQNGVIYISPKTVNPMYQVFKHELTHYIEDSDFYQDFQNTIFSLYDATELDTMRENLRRERSDIVDEFGNDEARLAAEIDKELTAILSQDKIFTDKKTIDQLAHRKPNIVQTVYRWIKNKLAVARGEMTAEEVKIMETAEQLYREALEQQKNNKVENTNESKNLIAKTNTGSNVVVLDSLMFSKKHKLNAATRDKIFNAFKTLLPKKFEINSDGNIVNFNKTSPKEFWYSKYSNWLKKNDQDIMRAKNLVVGQLGELINISENGKLEPERKGVVHVKDPTIGKNGFYHYDTTFAIPKFDGRKNIIGYEVYEGELVLDNNEDGNVYFYDLINIKESNTTVDKMSIRPSNKAGRSLLSNNSISNYSNKASKSTGLSADKLSTKTDNEGRSLTEQQKSYFKDSAIRDNNGSLKVMYHGSSNPNITEFNKKYARSSGYYGRGFYFADSESYVKPYVNESGKVYETYLNIKNPVQPGTNTFSKKQIKALVQEIADNEDYGLDNYGYGATVDSVVNQLSKKKDDFSILMDINSTAVGDFVETVKMFNEVNGTNFDGIVAPTETVAFYPEQIKLTSNESPTASKDIRYSTGLNADMLSSSTDSEGRKLSDNQRKFFKETKVVDNNGDLQPVYHASPNAEFYVFDKTKASPESDMGAGFYFSNQETDAESNYSDETGPDIKNKIDRLAEQLEFEDGFEDADYDERYEEAKRRIVTGKTKHEVYLNIKNPVYVGDNDTLLFTYDHLQEYADDFNDGEMYEGIEDYFVENLTEDLYGLLDDSGIQSVNGIVYDALFDGGIDLQRLKENLNNAYLEDNEGNWVANEVARKLVESLGYDGIIDSTVSRKFKGMGLAPDTVHYIAFNPNQIKKVTNQNPTVAEDIRYSKGLSADNLLGKNKYANAIDKINQQLQVLDNVSDMDSLESYMNKYHKEGDRAYRNGNYREMLEFGFDDDYLDEFKYDERSYYQDELDDATADFKKLDDRFKALSKPLDYDSEGRKLSKGQKEYFKNVDIFARNKDGELKVFYHGTSDGGFNVFTMQESKNGRALGDGYYFSDSKRMASEYMTDYKTNNAKNPQLYQVYLKMENTLSDVTYDGELADRALEICQKYENPSVTKDSPHIYYVQSKLSTASGVIDYFKYLSRKNNVSFGKLLKKYGYDSVNAYNEFVVFDSNQIKDIDNKNPSESDDIRFSRGLSASELLGNSKDPVVRARYQMEKRIKGTFLFNSKADPRKLYDITSRMESEFNNTGKISPETRQELFNAAYNETLKNADISYKELPEFKQMISEDLNRAVTQYENTLIKERELLKFAQENDIPVSEVKLNPTFGFLKNVKPEDLPDKIISYKKLKASLKSDLIGEVGGKYAGGKQIDSLIDQAAKEILEDGYIASTTKFKIHQEMVENGYTLNDERMNENKELYDRIKETKLLVPRGFNREIQDYDQTKKVLKTSTLEGRDIGDFYNSLNEDYGEQFPADIINPAQQYEKIYEVISALEPEIVWYEQSAERNAEIRQYLEDTFTDRLEDFKNQVVYRSQKDYYDRAAKKQVAQDSALNQISEAISEKFLKDNKEIDELKKTEDVIKSNVSIDELAQVVAKIRDRGALSKTLAQNLDAMAGGDVVLRAQLAEIFEKPLREAKRNYVTNQKRVLDDVYQRITQDLGIKMGSKESAAMMWYGEGKKQLNKVKGKVESDKLEFTQYTLDDLKKDFPETWKNIVEADSIMRKYYDEYVDRINQLLERIYSERNLKESVAERRTELQKEIREAMERLEDYKAQRQGEVGTPDVEARINAQRERIKNLSNQFNNVAEDVYRNKRLNKRSDYYHHFQEIGMVESIQEILKGDSANNISNALAGISENTKPKSKWASFMQKRSDVARYEEDAIKGFLKYAPAAEYKIAFDPYVAQMRGTIQDIIKLSDEANINNAKAINWLTNYTNALAGKTNPLDRWIAHTQSGRDVLQLLNKVNSRVKANAVAGNLNSAVSQFYNLPNGIAVLTDRGGVKAQIDLAKGSKDYAAYAAKKMAKQDVSDSPINQSVFLAERFIDSTLDRFDESILHKPQQAATFMLTFGDQVVAEQLWFSAYNQAQRLGKTDAIAYADDVVARAVGGRGIGEVPLAQQSQFVKLIAPFQVEVNNAWQLMKQMGSGALKDKDKALGLLLMYAATWLMNEINQVITGNRVGMDIFNAMQDAAEGWDSEKNVVSNTFTAAGRLGGEVLSNVPMGAQIAQKFVSDEYDRQKLFGESDPSRYGTGNIGINAIADPITQLVTGQNVDWQSVVTNFVTPYGGKQLNRLYKLAEDTGVIPRIDFNVNEGFQASKKPGAYNDKGNLKYQIDTTDPLNIAKGLAFGTYATKEGKKYIEQGYSALSENQTKIYESAVESGADLNYLYEAMRELPNIKSLKDDEGKTVKNSQAALSRLYLEQMGLYEDVVEGIGESGADPSGVKLSNTVINMTDEEFKKFLEELEKYRK